MVLVLLLLLLMMMLLMLRTSRRQQQRRATTAIALMAPPRPVAAGAPRAARRGTLDSIPRVPIGEIDKTPVCCWGKKRHTGGKESSRMLLSPVCQGWGGWGAASGGPVRSAV